MADGVVAGLLEVRRDGRGAADLVRDGRGDSRESDADGSGVLRGATEGARQGSDPAATQAADGESAAAVTVADGSEPRSRT